eukprot:GHVL01020597.1.p1 GENE.GHVL01020597.1~~GHVL01020597.1.p1  ORF type:complete len:137 (-),score=22.04 GHVL01020597.1:1248-1658(-)
MSNNINNRPEPSELQQLPPGVESRVQFEADSKLPHTGYFTLWLEDHTAGNLIRRKLLLDQANVRFAGYKVPHPLEPKLLIRLQTGSSLPPVRSFQIALHELKEEAKELRSIFHVMISYIYVNLYYNIYIYMYIYFV